MTVIERWNIEGDSQVNRTAIVVSGPMVSHGHQIRMVRASEYDALAEQLRGAVGAGDALADAVSDIMADDPESVLHTWVRRWHEAAHPGGR